MELRIFSSAEEIASAAAGVFLEVSHPSAVFGFATGRTPRQTYQEIAKLGGLKCRAAFSLDEYVGVSADDERSFASYVRNNIELPLNLPKGFVRVPNGVAADPELEARQFESEIAESPIDLQILGTGRNGHIAFNEPGSAVDSLSRVVTLAPQTLDDNTADFGSRPPSQAITQGIATILRAKKILLIAKGAEKRQALEVLLSGEVSADWPISYLNLHDNVIVLADELAAN